MRNHQLYYCIWYRLDQVDRFSIWVSSDENDYLFAKGADCLPSFPTRAAVTAFASECGLVLVEDSPVLHDLDLVQDWVARQDPAVPRSDLLSAWNFFLDLATTFPERAMLFSAIERDPRSRHIYEQLFLGTSAADIVFPREKPPLEAWTTEELGHLARALSLGLALLRSVLD